MRQLDSLEQSVISDKTGLANVWFPLRGKLRPSYGVPYWYYKKARQETHQ